VIRRKPATRPPNFEHYLPYVIKQDPEHLNTFLQPLLALKNEFHSIHPEYFQGGDRSRWI